MEAGFKKVRRWLSLLLAVIFVAGLGAVADAAPLVSKKFKMGDAAPGEIIVKFKPGLEAGGAAAAGAMGLQEVKVSPAGARLMKLRGGTAPGDVLGRLKADPHVAWAEPNYIVFAFGRSSGQSVNQDTFFNEQWGLTCIDAPGAWQALEGSSGTVTVAVVDTGVDASHPDLAERLLPGRNFASVKDNGEQYAEPDNTFDDNGHGTHVAGVAGAVYGNGLGIAGVAGPGSLTILPVKVLNDGGWGKIFDIAQGIRWAADNGAAVINLSLGGPYSNTMGEAVAYAQNKGALVVAAAGNDWGSVDDNYPAAYPGVLAVGALDRDCNRADFSSYGRALDLMAPGVSILSTVPQWLGNSGGAAVSENDAYYDYWDGTSMAAPHVAAAAGLYKLTRPGAGAAEIAAALQNSATDLGLPGWDAETGYGLLSVSGAVGAGPPGSAGALTFTAPSAGATVTGKVNVTVQVYQPGAVDRVDFFLDDTDEAHRLVEVLQDTPGQVNYSFTWDSAKGPDGAALADGAHTLYAKAFSEGEAQGAAAALTLTVQNQVSTGLLLQVLDPAGAPSPHAVVYVLRKEKGHGHYYPGSAGGGGASSQSGGGGGGGAVPYPPEGEEFYRVIMADVTDNDGRVRIPGTLATDLKQYEVIAHNWFDREGEFYPFIYWRHYEAPQSDVIDGSNAVPVDLRASGLDGQALPYALFSAGLRDDRGQRIFTVGLVEARGANCEIYLDRGAYDFFAFWNPEIAAEIGSFYGEPGPYNGPTHFLTRRGVQVASGGNVGLDATGAGRLQVKLVEGQDKGVIYLGSPDTSEALGWWLTPSGSDIVASAGDYWLGATLEQTDAGNLWTYYLEKDEPLTVQAGVASEISLGGGLTLSQTVSGEVYQGSCFETMYKFADSFDNRLWWTEYWPLDGGGEGQKLSLLRRAPGGQAPQVFRWQPKQVGWQEDAKAQNGYGDVFPTFTIYDSNDEPVYGPRQQSYYYYDFWYVPADQAPGGYRAELRLDTPGPISGGQSVSGSADFDVLEKAQAGTVDVPVTGRDGSPAAGAELRLFRRYSDTCEGEEYAYWGWLGWFTGDSAGVVKVPADLPLDPGGCNLAVVSYWDGSHWALAARQFDSLDELAGAGLSLAGTVPVDFDVLDRAGNPVDDVYINTVFLSDAGGRLAEKEPVTGIGVDPDGRIYLEPDIYHFYTGFNRWAEDKGESYYLQRPGVTVTDGGDNRVVLDCGATAHVKATAAEGYSDLYIYAFSENVPFGGLYTSASYNDIYLSPGEYTPMASLRRSDPENESHSWYYHLDVGHEKPPLALESGRDYQWQFGGPFTPDLELVNNSLTPKDNLAGSALIRDAFGNRLTGLFIEAYWYGDLSKTDGPAGRGTRSIHDGPALWRTGDGRVHLLEGDKAGAQSEDVAPFLRVYRQQPDGGEVRVFNSEDWLYYWKFDEKLDDWGAPGRYRTELAMGVGPEGPIATGRDDKYYFTVSGLEGQPVLQAPKNGAYLNTRSFNVSGLADPAATVNIFVYSGEQPDTTPAATATADLGGKFSAAVTVTGDGTWRIFALQQGQTTPSETVTVHVDATPPNKPVLNARLVNNDRSVQLVWSGETGEAEGVATEVYRDNSLLKTVTAGENYVDSTVQPGRSYSYQAAWVDKAGNRSPLSDPAPVNVPVAMKLNDVSANYVKSGAGYTPFDTSVTVTARGTPGLSGKAGAAVQKQDGAVMVDFILAERSSGIYQGTLAITEGMTGISRVDVWLESSDGGKTEVKDALKDGAILVGGSLAGEVRRGSNPVGGITVSIYSPAGDSARTTTGQGGGFRFDGLKPASYTVSVYDSATGTTVTKEAAVSAGVLTGVGQVELPVIRSLTVTVEDKNDNSNKLSGVWLRLAGNSVDRWQQTGSDGTAVFTGLQDGTYDWSTYGAAWLAEPYLDESGTLTVAGDETAYTVSLESKRSRTGSLTGQVTDGSGAPVSGATVSAWSWSQWGWGSATTGGDGSYTIQNLTPAGDYTVTFEHPDYIRASMEGQSIVKGQVTTLDRQLAKGATVTGAVYGTDINGNRQALANIPVYATSGAGYSYGRTDGSGNYTLKGLAAGSYAIEVYAKNMGYRSGNATVSVSEGAAVNQNFDLNEMGSIDGMVVNSAGEPIRNVYLNGSGPSYGWARTGSDGYYVMRGLEDGDGNYTVSTSNWQGYVDQSKPGVSVQAGQRATVNFTLNTRDELAQAFGGAGNAFSVNTDRAAPGERLTYKAAYKNGLATAVENVVLTLDVPENTTYVNGSLAVNGAASGVTPAGGKITVELGTVEAGGSGTITYQVDVSGSLNQEADLLAKGDIRWTAGGQEQNKPLGVAATTVVFTSINAPGLTADGKIKVYGKSLPGALVSVYDGNRLLGTTSVTGRWWNMDLQLASPDAGVEEETHTLYAQAVKDGRTSNLSEPATVVFRPGVPVIEDAYLTAGWNGDVKANPYTGVITMGLTEMQPISVRVKFSDNNSVEDVHFQWLDDSYSMTLGGDGYFRGNVPYGWTSYGERLVNLAFKDRAGRLYQFPLALITVLIDPSGYVYEGVPSNRLQGVTAVVQKKAGDSWVTWDAASFGQVNPQVTDDQGRYGWDVPAGTWRVVFSKDGYETYVSYPDWDGRVPPAKTDLNVNLKSTATPAVANRSPEGGNAAINSTVSVTFSKYMQVSSFNGMFTVVKEGSGEAVSGTITGAGAENGLARTIVFTPAAALEHIATYKVTVSKEVLDYTGRKPAAETTWTFTTAAAPDTTPPEVTGVNPADGATGVAVNAGVTATFSEPVQGVETNFTLKRAVDGSPVAAAVSYDAATRTATLDPTGDLAAGTRYTAALSDGITDYAGNKLAGAPYTWNFTIASSGGGGGGGGGAPAPAPTPAPQQTTQPASLSQAVPAAVGGTVATADRAVSLTLPAGGLTADGKVHIAEVAQASTPATGSLLAGSKVYDITVEGAALTKPATLTIKYDTGKFSGLGPEKIGLYYWNEFKNRWIYIGGDVDPASGLITAQVKHFTRFAVLANPGLPVLTDVKSHWAKKDIRRLVGMEIVNGYPDRTYRPDNNVTRAEFARILVDAMGWQPGSGNLKFADARSVPAWARGYVATAVEKGVLSGYEDNTFRAGQLISRAEIAVMVMRALGNGSGAAGAGALPFNDAASVPAWARDYVAAAVSRGIVKGKTGNAFAPADNATRAESAAMVVRMLENLGI